jgi:hypothetical protein
MRKYPVGLVVAAGLSMILTVALNASDRVGVYAVIEKVVLEPDAAAPERIQIWGAFAVSDQNSASTYGPAQRGYLYYTCPQGKESVCRKEWADMKSLAGTTTGIGFGHRYSPTGRIRKADEKAAAPDTYPIQMGIVRIENASDRGAETFRVIDRLRHALQAR